MSSFPIKLGKALLAAQGQMRGVKMGGINPHFKSNYATLENVTDTIRPVLQAHGVLFMQSPGGVNENGVMDLTTNRIHAESGEMISSTIGVPLNKRDPQGVGSAITYACRYSLMALLGLPPVDDDGESAGRAETTTTKVLSAKDQGAQVMFAALKAEAKAITIETALKDWMKSTSVQARIAMLPTTWQDELRTQCQESLALMREKNAP